MGLHQHRIQRLGLNFDDRAADNLHMDFDGAIQAHSNWKLRLFNYVRGEANSKIDLPLLGTDHHCALGQWLDGEGQRYANDPKFAKLREAHAALHASASSLALLVERGKRTTAESLLNSPDSEVNRLSFRVVAVLTDLATSLPWGDPQATVRTAQTDPQATRLPTAAPASTSLRKCIPNRMREAAMLRAQNNRPVARSG